MDAAGTHLALNHLHELVLKDLTALLFVVDPDTSTAQLVLHDHLLFCLDVKLRGIDKRLIADGQVHDLVLEHTDLNLDLA